MKICFNAYGIGYGNNGGTQTIYRMAMALNSMDYTVELVSDVDSRFTWFTLPSEIKHVKSNKTDADVVIDVSTSAIRGLNTDARRFLWLRGLETWRTPLEDILKEIKEYSGEVLVNSERLQIVFINNLYKKFKILYSGIPVDDLVKQDRIHKNFSIGALYSERKLKNWFLSENIFNKLGRESPDVKSLSFGMDDMKGSSSIYFKNPDFNKKLKLMSTCDLWLATSVNEGLHIPPMEAALCGACVVAPRNEASGVMDYANNETALMYSSDEEAFDKIMYGYNNRNEMARLNQNMVELIKNKIGDVYINAGRLLNIIGE